jgi:hypothetical protein
MGKKLALNVVYNLYAYLFTWQLPTRVLSTQQYAYVLGCTVFIVAVLLIVFKMKLTKRGKGNQSGSLKNLL